jgi:hypothetical protein
LVRIAAKCTIWSKPGFRPVVSVSKKTKLSRDGACEDRDIRRRADNNAAAAGEEERADQYGRGAQLNEHGLERILHAGVRKDHPLVFAHFDRLVEHDHFRPDLKPYVGKLLSKAAA